MPRTSRTPFVLLGLLCTRPMTGYELKTAIDRSIAHFWRESYGQLYPTLRKLEHSGWVRSKAKSQRGRARITYAITPEGRAELLGWLREAPSPSPPRNELLLKIFFGRFAGDGVIEALLKEASRTAKQEVEMIGSIARELEDKESEAPELRYWRMTLELGRRIAQVRHAWAQHALRELTKGREA